VLSTPALTVPHPRFRERRFVLEPLAELAPEWRDPVTGRTIAELVQDLES
jgi:2-amino-4-hydroxy-6-hydroxymethyldihydropteridine diphosphokinase